MKKQTKEIIWNLVNSFLAGVLVLLGAFSTGEITQKAIGTAVFTSLVVMASQFKDYWETQKGEYSNTKMFSFVKF